jgi:hypothetical protein
MCCYGLCKQPVIPSSSSNTRKLPVIAGASPRAAAKQERRGSDDSGSSTLRPSSSKDADSDCEDGAKQQQQQQQHSHSRSCNAAPSDTGTSAAAAAAAAGGAGEYDYDRDCDLLAAQWKGSASCHRSTPVARHGSPRGTGSPRSVCSSPRGERSSSDRAEMRAVKPITSRDLAELTPIRILGTGGFGAAVLVEDR